MVPEGFHEGRRKTRILCHGSNKETVCQKRKEGSLVSNVAEKRREIKIWEYSLDLVGSSLGMLTRAISVEYWGQAHFGKK